MVYCTSCKNEVGPFSKVPKLGYSGYSIIKGPSGRDSIIRVVVNYQDGDGDIGLSDADTFAPFNFGSQYYNNLIVGMFQIVDGKMDYVIDAFDDTVKLNQRIPVITPDGPDKALTGDMIFFFETKPFGVVNAPDSVKYTIFIYDRALQKSNIIETPVIFVE